MCHLWQEVGSFVSLICIILEGGVWVIQTPFKLSYLYHFVTGRLKHCLKFECFFFFFFFFLLQEPWVWKHYLQLIIFHHFVTGSLEWPCPAEWVCCCYGCHFCLVVCIHCKKSSSTIGSNCSIKLFLFFNTLFCALSLSLSLSLSLYLNACVCTETERWTAIVLYVLMLIL